MGGVLVHIKAFKPHVIPYQCDVFTEGIGGQGNTVLQISKIMLRCREGWGMGGV